jgi:hypothetical protein
MWVKLKAFPLLLSQTLRVACFPEGVRVAVGIACLEDAAPTPTKVYKFYFNVTKVYI